MLDADDQLAIHRLIALYAHVVDEREFSRLGEVFTADAEYDVRARGSGLHHGPEEIRRLWEEAEADGRHPLAHHTGTVLIDEQPDGSARVLSKAVCVRADGTVHSTTYRQRAVKTPAGWRLSYLTAAMRTPDTVPAIT